MVEDKHRGPATSRYLYDAKGPTLCLSDDQINGIYYFRTVGGVSGCFSNIYISIVRNAQRTNGGKRNTDFHIINLQGFKNWLPPIPLLPREDGGR